jgi:hypothetical protein
MKVEAQDIWCDNEERDGVKLGFAINGGEASRDGAGILVSDIRRAKEQIDAGGVSFGIADGPE